VLPGVKNESDQPKRRRERERHHGQGDQRGLPLTSFSDSAVISSKTPGATITTVAMRLATLNGLDTPWSVPKPWNMKMPA
jgi:hypothetical protein